MNVERLLEKSLRSFGQINSKGIDTLKSSGLQLDPEYYLYTKFDKFLDGLSFSSTSESQEVMNADITFENGYLVTIKEIPGIKVTKIDEKHPLTQELAFDHGLRSLHHSFINDAILIEVDKNHEVIAPLVINHMATTSGIHAPLVFVKLNPFSKLSLLENYTGSVSEYASIAETHIQVLAGAKLEHIQVDLGTSNALHHAHVYSSVARDASYSHLAFHLDGKVIRKNTETNLLESGSHAESYSLFLTDKSEHSDLSTVINHLSADTTSDQISKGILSDTSKGVFTGKIHIHPQAQRVASSQINRNLLLSPKAQIHSQPQLEIFADDVKCSHGSTTGQMSDEELFYFQARGIKPDRARTLLANGFALEVVTKINNSDLRQKISELVLKGLGRKFSIGE
ncbi:MAG TPA: Fe-S cluster assembly protein SufD [Bacteriovoracaceae bacterium]|nr:Fe-S cluster assembly protein SufD [Bacteriovoracaceae bacterium]